MLRVYSIRFQPPVFLFALNQEENLLNTPKLSSIKSKEVRWQE